MFYPATSRHTAFSRQASAHFRIRSENNRIRYVRPLPCHTKRKKGKRSKNEDPNKEFKIEILIVGKFELEGETGTLNKKTIVHYTSELLLTKGLKKDNKIQNIDGLLIYPQEYFCPGTYKSDKFRITKNTHTIHHYAATWVDGIREFYNYSLPFKLKFKIYICKEETREKNVFPKNELIIMQFQLTRRRYIVISLSKGVNSNAN